MFSWFVATVHFASRVHEYDEDLICCFRTKPERVQFGLLDTVALGSSWSTSSVQYSCWYSMLPVFTRLCLLVVQLLETPDFQALRRILPCMVQLISVLSHLITWCQLTSLDVLIPGFENSLDSKCFYALAMHAATHSGTKIHIVTLILGSKAVLQ